MEGAIVSLVSVGQYTGLRRFFGNPMVPSGPALSRIGIPRSSYTRGIGSAGRGATGPVQPSRGNHHCEPSGRNPSHHFRRRTTTWFAYRSPLSVEPLFAMPND